MSPTEFADALTARVAEAARAVETDGDLEIIADLVVALDRWHEDPLVSGAAATAIGAAMLTYIELEPLRRALVRAARQAWCADPDPFAAVERLRQLSRETNQDGYGLVGADLLAVAVEVCEEQVGANPAQWLPRLVELLTELVAHFDEPGALELEDYEEIPQRAAEAGRKLVAAATALVERTGARDVCSLAAAHMVAAATIARVDGPAVGADESARGVRLWEESLGTDGVAAVVGFHRAASEHIAMLERADRVGEARECERRVLARLRTVAAADDAATPLEQSNLAAVLFQRSLRVEAADVAARCLVAAERIVADGELPAVRPLAGLLLDRAEDLHRAGFRAQALRAWRLFIGVRARVRDGVGPDAPILGVAYRDIVARVEALGDQVAAVEFGDGVIREWTRLSEFDPWEHIAVLALELRCHADRLHRVGRVAEAADMGERAVACAETMSAIVPERGRVDLAGALNCASRMHLHADRAADADVRSRQAVELVGLLADTDPDRHAGALAEATHNRALTLDLLQDHEQALALSARAIEMYEQIAIRGDDEDRSALVNALCSGAILLKKQNDFRGALHCASWAATVYRRLVERDRHAYSSDLAFALNSVASIHRWMGASDEAVATAGAVLELCDPDDPGQDKTRATALHTIVLALSSVRRNREALTYSAQLLALRERMSQRRPVIGVVELAVAVGIHAETLSGLGELRAALDHALRARDLLRELPDAELDRHRKHVASVLETLAMCLAGVGRHDTAIEISTAAVQHYDLLLERDALQHRHSAAICLANHARRLEWAGHLSAAIEVGVRGVAAMAELVELDARGYRPQLGLALVGQSSVLIHADRFDEALDCATRSAALFEEVAVEIPDVFAEDLAMALHNQSCALSRLGRVAEALPLQERAVRIVEDCAAIDRHPVLPLLARVTGTLVERLVNTGGSARAVAQSRDAVALWTELADSDSDLYLPDLASALDEHARLCGDNREWDESVRHSERAAIAYRTLAATEDRYRSDWASAVEHWAHGLYYVGDRASAIAEAERALSIWRAAADDDPGEYLPNLAACEVWVATHLVYLGECDSAAVHMERGVGHYRALLAEGQAELLLELAAAYEEYATSLCQAGYCPPAPAAMAEAVALIRDGAGNDRAAHRHRLAAALRTQTRILSDAGMRQAAVASAREALSLVADIDGDDAADHRDDLADYHDSLADALAEAGQYAEALDQNFRALTLWEELAVENASSAPDLAWSLWHRARWQAATGGVAAEVLAVSQRAVDSYERAHAEKSADTNMFAAALVDHARHLARAGRSAEALKCSARALCFWEALAQDERRVHGAGLAECLRGHAAVLAQAGRRGAAVECARRALRSTAEAAARTRLRYLPEMAECCRELAGLVCEHDPGEADALIERARSVAAEIAAAESVIGYREKCSDG